LYSDYIKFIQSKPRDAALKYWKTYLTGVDPCYFQTTPDDAIEKQLRVVEVKLEIPFGKIKRFCTQRGITVSSLFQAAWGIVLRAYTGSDQVCFGYLVSGREVDVKGIEDAIGPFISMLICRIDTTDLANAAAAVKAVQQDYTAGLEHQHCSLGEVQHAMSISGESLFNTIMSTQRTSASPDKAAKVVLSFKSVGTHDPTEVSSFFIFISVQHR
jgi:non-ribosomal peptide synthetase component F